jgi:GNAT superfamily N-acetyltransferase
MTRAGKEQSGSRIAIRDAREADIPEIADLLGQYMHETYNGSWHGSAEALSAHAFGRHFHLKVAQSGARLLGFAAWRDTYDVHHCTIGGEIMDMFVLPAARGKGIGPTLVCEVAVEIRRKGGVFLKGEGVDSPSVRRLYERAGVRSATVQYTVSGRAFRRVADLAFVGLRELIRSLPETSWSYEA